ncbi:MAG: hypothetical protein KAS12_00020 [Candidatus Aenigmarchaeota archaeon]|nr:hypothetical protein [Candidatus Aenigmarchaeota archaeon]
MIIPSLGIASTPVEDYNASIDAGDINGAAQAEANMNAMDPSGDTAANASELKAKNALIKVVDAKLNLIYKDKIEIAAKSIRLMPVNLSARIMDEMSLRDLPATVKVLREILASSAEEEVLSRILALMDPVCCANLLMEWGGLYPDEKATAAQTLLDIYKQNQEAGIHVLSIISDSDIDYAGDIMGILRLLDQPTATAMLDGLGLINPGSAAILELQLLSPEL